MRRAVPWVILSILLIIASIIITIPRFYPRKPESVGNNTLLAPSVPREGEIGVSSSSPTVYMMVPNPSGRGHHSGSSIFYAVIFNNPMPSDLTITRVEIDASSTFNASGGLYPFQQTKSSHPLGAELTGLPLAPREYKGNIIIWRGNWTAKAESTLSFYAEVLLWDLHVPFVEMDIIGKVDYGKIALDRHETVFSAGSKPNLWYLADGNMAFNLTIKASQASDFAIRLTETTGIHKIQPKAELIVSIPAGWRARPLPTFTSRYETA